MTELTEKQREIYNFLTRFMTENGYPPTVKEIMIHFNFASPTAVTTHLTALEKKGYVKKTDKRKQIIVKKRPLQSELQNVAYTTANEVLSEARGNYLNHR